MITLIRDQKQIVVDFSFWQQSRRERYKQLIEDAGGVWKLIYLSVHADELRRCLNIRSKRFDANAAFPITEEILTSFLNGFEEPGGKFSLVF